MEHRTQFGHLACQTQVILICNARLSDLSMRCPWLLTGAATRVSMNNTLGAVSERRYKLLASIRRSRSQHVLAVVCDLHRPYIGKWLLARRERIWKDFIACLGTGGMLWLVAVMLLTISPIPSVNDVDVSPSNWNYADIAESFDAIIIQTRERDRAMAFLSRGPRLWQNVRMPEVPEGALGPVGWEAFANATASAIQAEVALEAAEMAFIRCRPFLLPLLPRVGCALTILI